MPSTYTLNNGIELVATGEQSGTWGDTTNTNFTLLDTSLDGQVTVTLGATGSSGSPNALPVSDGATSNGRNRLIIFADSGDLGGTAFVQLTPNDAEKIIYVRNNLSGSRSILLFQGTYNASNDYEVPAGTTAVVFFNGAGSGAVAANVFNNAHFDAMNVVGGVTITVDDNSTILNLVSTDTDANNAPKLDLTRNSASPAANDYLGQIRFMGEDAADNSLSYVSMFAQLLDPTDGGEDGSFELDVRLAGSNRSRMISNATETVFNDDSQDINFRIESDTKPNAFSLNGATGSVGFNVLDGDVTSDGTAARTYVGIIGTGNRGRLNIGSTAVNGADSGVISFVNGANELGNINMETNSGVQNAGKMYISSTDLLTINSAGGVVFNDNSANVDFRIESNGNANMFLVDASANTIGIGTTQMNVVGNNEAGINLLSDGMVGISRAGLPLKINRTAEGGMIELYEAGTSRGQIDIESDRILVRSVGDASGIRFDASGLTPFKNGSAADGTVDLGFASGRFRDVFISGGLLVGGTTSANALDDYEEGTFTPSWDGYSHSGSAGRYTKIGNTVIVHTQLVTGTSADFSGVGITNLPFTAANVSGQGSGFCWCDTAQNLYTNITCTRITQNTTTCILNLVNNGGFTAMEYVGRTPQLGASATFEWTLIYQAA